MKKTVLLLLSRMTFIILLLTGCGSRENQSPAGDEESVGWVYVPEFITMEEGYIDYGGILPAGDSLLYLSLEWDETVHYYVNHYSLLDKTSASFRLAWPEDKGNLNLNKYTIRDDGSLYVLARSYAPDSHESTDFLCGFDPRGNCLFIQDITGQLRENPESQTYISSLKTDGGGNVYLLGNEALWLFSSDGCFQGRILPDPSETAWFKTLLPGGNGQMYLICEVQGNPAGGCTLARIDPDRKGLLSVCTGLPDRNEFASGSGDCFLMQDRSCLYSFDPAAGETETLLNWLDCDINGNNIITFGELENGNLVAVMDSENGGEIAVLTKKRADQIVQKENIVLGVLSGGYNYQPAAVNFNRNNDRYHITIKEYYDYEDNSETAGEDALARLYADIVSDNCPQLLELTGLDVAALASRGVFEDLTPYLENSVLLSPDDFLEEILDAYTFNGRLASIPSLFFLETVMSRSSQTGSEPGWSVKDLTALADANPDAELFDGAERKDILNLLITYNRDSFIDWENGECSFDTEEFRDLLRFANRFPEEGAYTPGQPSTPIRIQNGEVLLKNVYLYDFDSIQMDLEIFQGEGVCIGFPTGDGSPRHGLTAAFTYAITSKAKDKEGAWSFIESILAEENNKRNQMGFPTLKRRLEAMIEDATKIEYILDEYRNPWLDENGQPVINNNNQTTSYGDGWSYTYHTATREEVDMILSLLDGAALTAYVPGDKVMNIITQEAEAYFSGQKTVEEVTAIIQNRINIYVKENQ